MSQFFRSHRGVNEGGKKLPVMRGKGQRELASVENEGESSVVKGTRLFLGRDDVQALHHFFGRMQSTNTNFFYLMDLDEDGRLKNVFWADGRCKTEYQYFSDVVTLDTNYLTNNYETPLVSFVGANHHGHSILFGSGLLSDRSVETYRWLFKSWLSCMSANPPNAIITDHCKAIQEAVAEVFPGARHRMCVWNIMKRVRENLAGYAEYKAIKEIMKGAVHDSVRIEEFEEDWRNMIKTYGLEDNEWLNSLYENRHYWVPVFVRGAFWAGMSNTQNKENTTSFFDGHIYPKTSLKQFVCKYETILQSKYEKEVQANLDSFNKSPQLISKFYMEDQLRKIYTVDMFKKFQEEIKAILYCIPSLVRVDGPVSTFEVKEPLRMKDGNQMETKDYEVTYNSNEQDVRCICCYFQSIGILCRHTLSVLNFLEVYEIPPQFIVDRWRKDNKHRHGMNYSSNDVIANGPMERYDNLYRRCLRFVELGVISGERYEYALKLIGEVTEELISSDCTISDMLPRNPSTISGRNMGNEDEGIPDIIQVRRKSQPPKKRKEPLAEKIVKGGRKKASQRNSMVADQNDAPRITPDTPQFDPHIWAQENINLTEQVSPTNLSIGSHFGVQIHHPHGLDNQSGIRWSFQQMFQQGHTPEAPPGPWAG
ncbi:protein FAR1-RELATED SEQUENCE 6-like isoform X2 [Asparagus officinalis]|nr:protein FAR1-RELATED SEQUENCE 6-like isoform X2 [Asparagus officinalis]XP_020269085.1 protein FAR1-RELATED SEQUENCE 6-like isoform X2 [Asparagus officinalis]XP_020269086.1 protein FAR1-RELATED SEQUENCE 6-like isoform X2 [Asparagus officinalis]